MAPEARPVAMSEAGSGLVPDETNNNDAGESADSSTSTEWARYPHTRKRKKRSNSRKSAQRMASAKREKQSKTRVYQERKTRTVESTMLSDPNVPVERFDEDLYGSALRRRRFGSRFASRRPRTGVDDCDDRDGDDEGGGDDDDSDDKADGDDNHESKTREPLRACPPAIPRFDDDDEEYAVIHSVVTSKHPKPKGKRGKRKEKVLRIVRLPVKLTAQQLESSKDEASTGAHGARNVAREARPPEPPGFMTLSAEIRDKIYRELLLADRPIQVHGNWRLVYKGAKRNRLSLSTGILAASKAIHEEASRVLYGENEFLYLLRDLPCSVTNVQGLAGDDDEVIPGDEGESGSEWEGEVSKRTRRRQALLRRKADDFDINLDRYSRLFRRIAVMAEHNRYSGDTQESMAGAIERFALSDKQGRGMTRGLNIRRLTVRIAPRWDLSGQGSFTFVDFFRPGSRVLEAIKSVECQWLYVDLLTKRGDTLEEDAGVKKTMERPACRLRVDMRHLRIWRQLGREQAARRDDWWRGDRVMLCHRRERARRSLQAVDGLAEHVERTCHERGFQRWTTGAAWSFDEMEDEYP